MKRGDVKQLVAYMGAVWPSYLGWDRYSASRTVDVWQVHLAAAGLVRADCIAAVDAMVAEGAKYPPGLPELVRAAGVVRDRRHQPERDAAQRKAWAIEYERLDEVLADVEARLADAEPQARPGLGVHLDRMRARHAELRQLLGMAEVRS